MGHETIVTRDPLAIADASHVVLPGVGAFRDCMNNLERYGLIDSVYKAIKSGKPFLGICLGLQLLFDESDEFGSYKGLGVIKGRVVRFPDDMAEEPVHPTGSSSELRSSSSLEDEERPASLKIPHMGWNSIEIRDSPPILEGIRDGAFFYFVHSYYIVPEDEDAAATTTTYGIEIASSNWKDNIFACQFHPEKSQSLGLKILRNFGEL